MGSKLKIGVKKPWGCNLQPFKCTGDISLAVLKFVTLFVLSRAGSYMGPHNENHLKGLRSQCDIKHFVTLEFLIVDKCREENFWNVVSFASVSESSTCRRRDTREFTQPRRRHHF